MFFDIFYFSYLVMFHFICFIFCQKCGIENFIVRILFIFKTAYLSRRKCVFTLPSSLYTITASKCGLQVVFKK